MKAAVGMENSMMATRSPSCLSQKAHWPPAPVGGPVQCSVLPAKYSHQEGMTPMNTIARNHSASEATAALVQFHSNSLRSVSQRSCAPFGTSLIDLPSGGPNGADYSCDTQSASNTCAEKVARREAQRVGDRACPIGL